MGKEKDNQRSEKERVTKGLPENWQKFKDKTTKNVTYIYLLMIEDKIQVTYVNK